MSVETLLSPVSSSADASHVRAQQSLKGSLGFLLNRAGVAMGKAFAQELKMAGMTLSMWRVLAALNDTGHQSLSCLSDFISVEISTLSRQVTTLTSRGLVISQPSGENWRSVDLSLTAAGQMVVQRLRPATERHERAALDGTDPIDVQMLKQMLDKIYANLCALDEVLPVMAYLEENPAPQARAKRKPGSVRAT